MIIVMHALRDMVPYAGLTESGPVESASAALRNTPGDNHGLFYSLLPFAKRGNQRMGSLTLQARISITYFDSRYVSLIQ